MSGSSVPEAARAAALMALATKFALSESPVNLVVDAVLDAAAPFIVAAAVAEERATTGRRIEALAADYDAVAALLRRPEQDPESARRALLYQGHAADLRAALASPGEET